MHSAAPEYGRLVMSSLEEDNTKNPLTDQEMITSPEASSVRSTPIGGDSKKENV